MDMRQAWQFPATHALLSLLSTSHSVPTTTPSSLEDALQTPDSPLLAQLHAKLLRLTSNHQHKWRASILRYIANHPQYFDQRIPQPQDDDAYDSTTPLERLLLLHALAEAVLSEHPPEAPVERLRSYPIGTDALKNQYWYFGDAQRIYREPGELARTEAEKEAKASEQQQAAAEKDARRREREEKREAIERRREEKRKRDAEKWAPRVAVGRSTRASRRLQQKADQQKEDDNVDEREEHSEENEDSVTENWLLREIGFSSGEEEEGERDKKSKQRRVQEDAPRRSGRRRKPVQQPSSPPAKRPRRKDPSPAPPSSPPPPPPPPPPKRKEFADPTLRACSHWETLSTNADELRAFIARFGAREKLAPVERSLLKQLDEILPEMDEAEARVKREADRKAKTEFLMLNQKRSTRVQAIYARREEEARREAEREEKEREEATRIGLHERAVFEAISFLVREQSRDIRGARREYGMDEAIDRDEVAIRKQEREKALRVAALAPVRRSARMHRTKRPSDGEAERKSVSDTAADATAVGTKIATESTAETNAEAPTGTAGEVAAQTDVETAGEADAVALKGTGADGSAERQPDTVLEVGAKGMPNASQHSNVAQEEARKEEAVIAKVAAEEVKLSVQTEGESKAYDLEDRGTTIDSMEDTAKSSPEQEQKRTRFSSASPEESIGKAFTWSTNDEDKLPMRVLDKFFFASIANFADAPLENCEVPESGIVGFGALIPPTTAPPDVERVEISRIVEWMFEYGGSPKIWIKSENAWYELREPAVEYQKAFVSARRKFEICARVAIMGDTMRGSQLNYGSILDYLSYPYGEMLAYQDSDVLTEKRYIVSQIELLNKRALLHSGFIRELQKRIRAEDRKVAQARAKIETHEAALEIKREEDLALMRDEDMVIVAPMKAKGTDDKQVSRAEIAAKETKPKEDKKSPKDKTWKRAARKRAGKPVPRAVSSIINGMLRQATKSHKTPRKRKPKEENGAKEGCKSVQKGKVDSPKRNLPLVVGNSVKKNGTVGVAKHDASIVGNGYHGTGEIQPIHRIPTPRVGSFAAKTKSPSRSPGIRKERRVHPLVPKMVGHGMSAFVALPRPQVVGDEVDHMQNGFRGDGKKE